ncbi:MAG: NUDIX domain-containing protein [Pseudomonadota bacterium]
MNGVPTAKRIRRAARIIVLDPQGLALMFRFDVADRLPFWVTAGGECEPGESFDEAARRELFEETGITADPGPQIAQTAPEFVTVEGEPVRADERYYMVRVDEARIDTANHTELEKCVMTQHRWFALSELRDWDEAIYPESIADMIEQELARQ